MWSSVDSCNHTNIATKGKKIHRTWIKIQSTHLCPQRDASQSRGHGYNRDRQIYRVHSFLIMFICEQDSLDVGVGRLLKFLCPMSWSLRLKFLVFFFLLFFFLMQEHLGVGVYHTQLHRLCGVFNRHMAFWTLRYSLDVTSIFPTKFFG